MDRIQDAVEVCSLKTGRPVPAGLAATPEPGEPGFAYQARVLAGSAPELKHCVLAEVREWTEACESIRQAWIEWCIGADRKDFLTIDYPSLEAPLDIAHQLVAELHDCMVTDLCREAYESFKAQTAGMYELLTDGLGITVSVWDERHGQGDDPYPSAAAQVRDVIDNHHLWINRGEFFVGENPDSPTGTNHPYMTAEDYVQWRAVHDGFGHSAIGSGFDRHGEYAAWVVHCSMYEMPGRLAMTTEARGVNTHLWLTGEPLAPARYGVLLPERFATP